MSSLSVFFSPGTQGTSSTTILPPPAESFNRLNCALLLAPADLARSHAHKETLWNTAKVVSILGYLTIAGAAFVATSVFAPSYILLTTFGTFLAMPVAVNGYAYSNEKAEDHAMGSQKFKRIAEIHDKLNQLCTFELEHVFAEYGIKPWNIQNFYEMEDGLKKLSVGLATMIYLAERTQELFKRHKEVEQQLETNSDPQFRFLQMQEAHYLKRAVIANWVHAAYTRALLANPYFEKTLDDIGSLTQISPEAYALEKLYGKTPNVFIFKDNQHRPLEEWNIDVIDASSVYNHRDYEARALDRLSRELVN